MTKIHSNKINFTIRNPTPERKYSLISGEFHIKNHEITSGQPNEVTNGDILQFNESGEFDFQVGRKASKEVAQWFNAQCNPKSNTTFGHRAKKLNFACLGTLHLKIIQESTNRQFAVVFDDILIGQGSSGSTNNWWFGGKTCTKMSKGKIKANGSTDDQNNFGFTFLRGGKQRTNVHTVEIIKIEYFTWMKAIDENKFLNQINIPGTHDSGTYNFKKVIVSNYVTTQDLSIRGQLDHGIRFLDIRCRHINDSFTIHHDKYYCNLVFGEVLKQCISFLQDNQSECIVMMVKEEYKPENNTRKFYETFLKYVNDSGGSAYWYDKNTIPRLKDVRKKIVLLHRFQFLEHSFGISAMNWLDNKTFKIKSNYESKALWIQDQYSVTWTQKAEAISDLVNESIKREDYWYFNFSSLSPSISATIKSTAKFMNTIMYKIASDVQIGFLGVIVMDYPNSKEGLTARIIDNNQYFKDHLYPKIPTDE